MQGPQASAATGACCDPWLCAEHSKGLAYSSGDDKTFSIVTREIVQSQAAKSPPVQNTHSGCSERAIPNEEQ